MAKKKDEQEKGEMWRLRQRTSSQGAMRLVHHT